MARNCVLYLLLGILVQQFEKCSLIHLDLKVGVNVKFVQRETKSENGVCITSDCKIMARELLEYVDFDKRPCTDFYDFVCGKFMRNDSIPLSPDNIQNFDNMYNRIDSNIDSLMESQVSPAKKVNENEVKKFYDSCMDTHTIQVKGVEPLMEFLEPFQGWPLLQGNNWTNIKINMNDILTTLYQQGVNGLFKISLYTDQETKLEIITLSEPDAVFPIDYYQENSTHHGYVTALENYITDVAVHFSSEKMRGQIQRNVRHIRAFKGAISGCIAKQRQSADAHLKTITLMDYNDHFGTVDFDLQIILKRLLEGIAKINKYDKVNVEHPKYMNCLYKVLDRKTKREMVDYLFWELIESLTYAMPRVYRDRRNTFKDNIDEYHDYSSTKEACLELLKANLIEAFGAYYARTHIDKRSKKRAKDLVRYIKKGFLNVLKANKKMDYETKDAAIKKLRYMREFIGYPDYVENETYFTEMFSVLKIDPDKSFIENLMTARRIHVNEGWRLINLKYQPRGPRVTELNAFFNHHGNSQELSAALLLPPFYSDKFPMFWNFGALGFTIAHEMNHGFILNGREFDENGVRNGLWSQRSMRSFDIKGRCFIKQYNNFHVAQVNKNINGARTLSENLADNAGVKLAYSAYVNWLEVNGEEPRLPGFNFTSKQMFFISFGRYFCGKPNDDILNLLLDTDSHSASQFRVIGSLRNSVEFAETFQCDMGEPMNPPKKCKYW